MQQVLSSCLVVSVLFCGPLQADEQPWLNLLRPDSLIGWNAGASTSGWSMHDGVMTAAPNAGPLVSGWTVGDFALEYDVTADEAAEVVLMLDDVEDFSSPQIEVELAGHGTLVRTGERGFIQANSGGERERTDIKLPAKARVGLSLFVRGGGAHIRSLALREPLGKPLVNGQDLTGWWTPGTKEAWHVEEGVIVKRGRGGNYLRTEREYGNFTLALEYRLGKGNNSGIGIRTPKNGWPSGDGMELQLLDRTNLDSAANMSIYRNVEPLAIAHKSKEWNHAVIKADGFMISAWINGELVQHHNTFHHPELKHRHLKGWIGFQDHGGVAEFRNIHLLEAPDTPSPIARTVQRGPDAATMILDRIMNQEVLSRADGVRTEAVVAQCQDGEEKVLAEFQGPGGFVGLHVEGDGGELAFTFDGEDAPRVVGQAKNLRGKLPVLSDEKLPLLTFAGYSKSLRIVHTGGGGGKFLIESVAFTKPSRAGFVQTFTDPKQSIPRGWLAAIDYRHNHAKYGQHRENDPDPRAGEKNQQLEPGGAVPLLALEGAGIVNWMKLHADAPALASENLWLDITVDGEAEPAISAPARFLFAAIADGRRHNNFVMTQAGGYFSRLPMPFGMGLTVVARNTGTVPLKGIGLTVSYKKPVKHGSDGNDTSGQHDPADYDVRDVTNRMRLHGSWIEPNASPLRWSGSGRLVGLVCEPVATADSKPPTTELSLASVLLLDGKPLIDCTPGSESLLFGLSGDPGDARHALSGRAGGLLWRSFLLAPREFQKSLTLGGKSPTRGLVLYYQARP